MNIIEAIKSGKPFRRKNDPEYCGSNGDGFVCPDYALSSGMVTKTDILADDWEIQEKTITITESQFDEACKRAFNCKTQPLIELLKKELGL